MRVHLHIDRLILDGLPVSAAQGASLQAALSIELGRLLTAEPWSGSLHNEAVPHLRGGPFAPSHNDSPRQLGNKIAQAVHGGVRRAG